MKYLMERFYFVKEARLNTQTIDFNFNNSRFNFSGINKKDLYSNVIDWLYESGYKFSGDNLQRKLLSKNQVDELVRSSNMRYDKFHKISGTDKYIITNFIKEYQDLIYMLKDFGAIEISFNQSRSEVESKTKKYTFIEAAQLILKQNDNKPMSARKIWDEIESQDLVETKGSTPWATLNASMIQLSSNSNIKSKRKTELFEIVDKNPYTFRLLNPEGEVQNIPDVDEVELEEVTFSVNPFGGKKDSSAICVLGDSGSGKSYTVETILESEGHEYEFIIPTAATTGILSQFSPSKNSYTLSKLGKLLIQAANDPENLYTAVFDECHKSNVIEMINDELLQAISTRRNRFRFITLDPDTAELYENSNLETDRGRLKISDNFGFIFISSKPKVISNNDDFANRVDFVYITKEDRSMKTIDELLSKKQDNIYSNKREDN